MTEENNEIIQRDDLTPEYYDIVPLFNSSGRLCNYRSPVSPEDETVRVMAGEWERFNQLAGRKYEIMEGTAVYSEELEMCEPDVVYTPTAEQLIDIILGVSADE